MLHIVPWRNAALLLYILRSYAIYVAGTLVIIKLPGGFGVVLGAVSQAPIAGALPNHS